MAELLTQISILVAGLALLWLAGEKTVRYAIELTDLLGISSFVVGFVIMSVSTGLPEITTAIFSSAGNVAGLSAGNLLGASLINFTLILGASILAAGTLPISEEEEKSLLKILLIVILLASLIHINESLTVWHGVILIITYIASILILKKTHIIQKIVQEETREAEVELGEEFMAGIPGTTVKFLGSLFFVALGAKVTVDSAVVIAGAMGASLESIGVTKVALGTTLPELSLELNAVRRKEYALALGDLFGSTLVNLTLVLGMLSIISPTRVNTLPLAGTAVYFLFVMGVIWFMLRKNHQFEKRHGILLIILFLIFILEEIGIASLL